MGWQGMPDDIQIYADNRLVWLDVQNNVKRNRRFMVQCIHINIAGSPPRNRCLCYIPINMTLTIALANFNLSVHPSLILVFCFRFTFIVYATENCIIFSSFH